MVKNRVINFFRITKKKIVVTLMFPVIAVLTLFSGFVLDEVLGVSGSVLVNAIYSLANHFYLFILLPITFIDDLTPSIIVKLALVLTLGWWYVLSCISIFVLDKKLKRK